jgi:hypothetical protein
MTKLIMLAIIIGAGYWYWSGPYQQGGGQTLEEHLRENRNIMRRCMKREATLGGAAGLAGVGGVTDGAETLCANENNLYKRDGEWYTKTAEEY